MSFYTTLLGKDFFDIFNNEFFFNSTVKDMYPYASYKKNGDYIIEVKTLGVDENDISVKLEGNILEISGETKNGFSDKPFNVGLKLTIPDKTLAAIKEIEYKVKNGLTYVYLKMEEPKTNSIKINKVI